MSGRRAKGRAPRPAGGAGPLPIDVTPLPAEFHRRTPIALARALLGRLLVRSHAGGRLQIGRIVETEAYLGPHDLAAHSARGRTSRTEVLFGPAGRAYVYLVYGLHHCFNVGAGRGAAVLVRALEPIHGITVRTDGPGRLTAALGIDRALNGTSLDAGPLWIASGTAVPATEIERTPRIGVEYAGAWASKPLRFHLRSSPFVSRAPRRRR